MTHRTSAGPVFRLAALATAAALAGCSSLDGVLGGARVDYRGEAVKTPELDVPPDLTQLARDGRFRPQAGGAVSASSVAAGTAPAGAVPVAAPATATVALSSVGGMRIERDGNFRWLVVPMTPEQLWPQLQGFWRDSGFALVVDNAPAGLMETGWAENRAKIPQDVLRRTLGRLVDGLYDSGVRDSFRTRVERGPRGTEVFIMHRSMTEAVVGPQQERTVWRAGPNDPQLEAEFLSRLLVRLGSPEASARQLVAEAPQKPAAPGAAAAAPAAASATPTATSLELNEAFDRAYRRVGIALDRGGFTVEDRDRSAGLFFVRYVDASGPQEQGLLSRVFGSSDAKAPERYRVLVRSGGDNRSTVTVQNSQGQPETGPVARQIIAALSRELR
jgi:outer membrane protein assembly factor BamC